MLSHDAPKNEAPKTEAPKNLVEESYEALKDPERGYERRDAVCGAIGLLVLLLMLLIATGTVPLYDWPARA
ncbi:hypothetical protein [Nocardioides dilutus]